jgi:hypothetical protein
MRFHHGREDVGAGSPERDSHGSTEAPQGMVARLLVEINRRFYARKDVRAWTVDKRAILKAITWPAVWLNERGVGMPERDYEAKVIEIIDGISRHGDLAKIKFFPAYLGDCIRKHFVHQGDEIYATRKHVRQAIELSFLKGRAPAAGARDVVPAIAAAHLVLTKPAKAPKPPKPDGLQGTLF